MKLLYLCVRDYRSLQECGLNFDSNERFEVKDGKLEFACREIVPEGFFRLDKSLGGRVESVSAIVGKNGVPTWWKGVISERLFRLSSVYSQLFAGDAIDAIHRQTVFSPAYLEMVKEWFAAAGLGTVNVERLVFGIPTSRDSINLQRLGKLKLDLQRQFGQK